MTMRWQRRLITMVKLREPAEGEKARCELQEQGEEVAHENFSEKYFMDESRRIKKDGWPPPLISTVRPQAQVDHRGAENSILVWVGESNTATSSIVLFQ